MGLAGYGTVQNALQSVLVPGLLAPKILHF